MFFVWSSEIKTFFFGLKNNPLLLKDPKKIAYLLIKEITHVSSHVTGKSQEMSELSRVPYTHSYSSELTRPISISRKLLKSHVPVNRPHRICFFSHACTSVFVSHMSRRHVIRVITYWRNRTSFHFCLSFLIQFENLKKTNRLTFPIASIHSKVK